MKSYNAIIIITILLIVGYIHQYIHKKISVRDDVNIQDPYKHVIYKQATVDFTTIVFLYLLYNRKEFNIMEFFSHIIIGSFGFFVFYHIIQPYLVNQPAQTQKN
jgi:hypothetical protein